MKKILIVLFIPLFLMGSDVVTDKRLSEIFTNIGIKNSWQKIGKRDVLMITHKDGLSFLALHKYKLTLISLNENFTITNKNKVLEKINNFNKNIIFARVFINKTNTAISSSLNVINGATDIKIINFIGSFLAIRENFLKEFSKQK